MRATLLCLTFLFGAIFALRSCNQVDNVDINQAAIKRGETYTERKKCEEKLFEASECSSYYSSETALRDFQFAENCQFEEFLESTKSSLGLTGEDPATIVAQVKAALGDLGSWVNEGQGTASDRLKQYHDEVLDTPATLFKAEITAALNPTDSFASNTFVSSHFATVSTSLTASLQTVADAVSDLITGKESLIGDISVGNSLENVASTYISQVSDTISVINDLSAVIPEPEDTNFVENVLEFSLLQPNSAGYVLTYPLLSTLLPKTGSYRGYKQQTFDVVQHAIDVFDNGGFDTSSEASSLASASSQPHLAAYQTLISTFSNMS